MHFDDPHGTHKEGPLWRIDKISCADKNITKMVLLPGWIYSSCCSSAADKSCHKSDKVCQKHHFGTVLSGMYAVKASNSSEETVFYP